MDEILDMLEKLKGGVSNVVAQFKAMAGGGAEAFTGVAKASGGISALGSAALSLAGGPLPSAQAAMTAVGAAAGGALTSGAEKASKALAMLGPEGAAAGAALEAYAAIASATIGTLATLAGMAVEAAQKVDLLRSRFAALSGSAAGGKAVQAMIAHLDLPFATDQVNAWAQSLLAAGVNGAHLEADLRAIAAASALMGESGASAATDFFKRIGDGGPAAKSLMDDLQKGGRRSDKMLKEMGLSFGDLGGQAVVAKMSADQLSAAVAKALQKKGAGPLAEMALTFPSILQKAREGFLSLFGGLSGPVKSFMQAVSGLFGQFSKGSPVIKALKPIVTEVFGAAFKAATLAVKAVSAFIKENLTAASIKSVWASIKSVWATISPVLHMIGAAFKAAWPAIKILGAIFLAVGAVMIGTALIIVGVFVGIAAAIATAVFAIVGAVADAAGALSGWIGGASDAASNFISGLVGGISAGAGAVFDAIKGLASGALSAFTGALGIHSPSAILWEHGESNMAGAVAGGVDQGGTKVKASMAKLGDDAAGAAGGSKGGGRGRSGGGGDVYSFSNCTFGGGLTEDTVRAMFQAVSERLALEAGSAPEPST